METPPEVRVVALCISLCLDYLLVASQPPISSTIEQRSLILIRSPASAASGEPVRCSISCVVVQAEEVVAPVRGASVQVNSGKGLPTRLFIISG